ncbi:hypothetical protein FRB99_000817 [Tulasnella sp. 403]|nr:hypothetical protein FRB99_000817 [Tulasnella sp. 403]
MLSQKRRRVPSIPGGGSNGGTAQHEMRIELPAPDLSQFKPPIDPPGQTDQTQRGAPNNGPSSKPLFMEEVVEMMRAIKGHPPPPLPKTLLSAFGSEIQRLDQTCDLVEARILHALTILNREANKHKAKLAEEQAAREAERKMQDVEMQNAQPSGAAADVASKSQHEAHPVPGNATSEKAGVSNISKGLPSSAPDTARRIPSTGPTGVSLSTLSPVSTDPGVLQQELTGGSQNPPDNVRPGARRANLRLDLSGTGLRGSFTSEAGQIQPPSPVTLAPKTAKPRGEDPMSAVGLVGPSPFNPSVASFHPASATAAAFGTNSATGLPLVNPVSAIAGARGLLPSLLSSMAGGPSAAAGQLHTTQAMHQFVSMATQQQPSQEVIDLTQTTPSLNAGLNLPMGGGSEPIDLTIDSPPVSLKALANPGAPGHGSNAEPIIISDSMTGLELAPSSVGTKDDTKTVEGGSTQNGKENESLHGLISSIVGGGHANGGGNANAELPQNAEGGGNEVSVGMPSSLPADARSLLARLTAAAAAQNAGPSHSADGSSAPNPLQTLSLGLPAFTNLSGLGSLPANVTLPMQLSGEGIPLGLAASAANVETTLQDMSVFFGGGFGGSEGAAAEGVAGEAQGSTASAEAGFSGGDLHDLTMMDAGDAATDAGAAGGMPFEGMEAFFSMGGSSAGGGGVHEADG